MAKQGSKAKRRIVKAMVEFISLCPKGANTLQTVYKADDGSDQNVSFTVLSKDMTEQGEIFACVYSPELVDSQGDTASAEVIKEMAYGFAVNGQGIDIRHNNQVVPKDKAFIAESFIVQKGDPRSKMKDYEGKDVDITHGWGVVIKIEDEELRKLYKSGAWGGVSMGGLMIAKDEPSNEASSLIKVLKELLGLAKTKSNDMENDMTPEQIAALKKEITTDVVAAVKEALKPAQETEVEKAARLAKENKPKLGMGKVKPVLKANATEEEIAIHLKKMEIFELSETVDPTDIHSVREFQKMAKEIATGKAADGTVPAKKNDAYGSFFKTNQTVSQAQKADGDAEYGDLLLAQMDKEDKERQNLKIA